MFQLQQTTTGGGAKKQTNNNSPASGPNLADYVEVPPEEWMSIERDTFIRYEKTDGQIVRGGFVKGKSITAGTLQLSGDLIATDAPTWVININSIKRLWKKKKSTHLVDNGGVVASIDASLPRMIKALSDRIAALETGNTDDIEENLTIGRMESEIAHLTHRVRDLEDDTKKIYEFLKDLVKLHQENKQV